MKIPGRFLLWHTILCIFLLLTGSALAQDAPGGKPEITAPPAAMPEHAHAPRSPSTTLAIALISDSKTLPPAKPIVMPPQVVAGLPHETVTVINGHTNTSETYSGVPVSALLVKLGLPFEKTNEHTLLRTFIIAQGTDGYTVILSAYETLSAIRDGNVIVADKLNGKPLDQEGAFKLVIPGDKRPQRWVQNLKSLAFKTVE
jgi:hypothetical protein